MGRLGAEGMAQAVEDGLGTLEQALSWHLGSNHFPPVSRAFIPVCIEAIEAASDEGWERELTMPNGLVRTAGFIVEGLHLDSFVREEE